MVKVTERGPYTPDEKRVCDYLQQITSGLVGCGEDPIGFLMASHAMLVAAQSQGPGQNKHTYPEGYEAGGIFERPYAREAWAVLDSLPPGAIPDNLRNALAGIITGMIQECVKDALGRDTEN